MGECFLKYKEFLECFSLIILILSNTHVVCCILFDKQLYIIRMVFIIACLFGKRPSCSCLVLL